MADSFEGDQRRGDDDALRTGAFSYGVDYEVLGYLVQVVSGQPLEAFLQDQIFQPLGMVDTAFAVPASKDEPRILFCTAPLGAFVQKGTIT